MADPIDETSTPTPVRRWFGYRPLTIVIIGAVLSVVLLLEAQWLWSPLRSGSSTSAAVATATTDSTDPGDSTDPSSVDSADPGPAAVAAVAFHARSRVTIRSAPSSASTALGHVASGESVSVSCVAQGEAVKTSAGSDPKWYHVTIGTVSGYLTGTLVAPAPNAKVSDVGPC